MEKGAERALSVIQQRRSIVYFGAYPDGAGDWENLIVDQLVFPSLYGLAPPGNIGAKPEGKDV